jgi:hypothetical protein
MERRLLLQNGLAKVLAVNPSPLSIPEFHSTANAIETRFFI